MRPDLQAPFSRASEIRGLAMDSWPAIRRATAQNSGKEPMANYKVGISMVPPLLWGANLRKRLTRGRWNKLRVVQFEQVPNCQYCGSSPVGSERPGCIIYVGAPDQEFRKRVRNALSFALGAFLVDLGSVAYTDEWAVQSFRLNSAYSIGRRVFDLQVLHPAPLHMNWQHGIDRVPLNRIVNAIVEKYDEIDFGNLGWAYWHALCATPHIAGVHFGAAIEALQRRYIAANPTKIQTKIIDDRALWSKFSDAVDGVIANSALPEESKAALRQNIGSLNKVHQKAKMDALLRDLGIVLGPEEALAWKRRNDAAHGNEMEAGGELSLIQDNKLLKVVFHRMLLRITNASDLYFDYATPGFPIRRLVEPSSSASVILPGRSS